MNTNVKGGLLCYIVKSEVIPLFLTIHIPRDIFKTDKIYVPRSSYLNIIDIIHNSPKAGTIKMSFN